MTERALVLDQLEGQWQKIVAVLVYKFAREKGVLLTVKDFLEFEKYMINRQLLTWGHYDSFEFRLVTPEEAERLAKHVESIGGKAKKPT